jgi:F-type H+-transporting ATPase subunit epsilon
MSDLKIEIVSIEGSIFKGLCNIAVVPSTSGDLGIMRGHEAIISNLREGDIHLYDNSQNIFKTIAVKGGFAEMQSEEKLLILID